MENYVLLYGDKKPEDNVCVINMFKNNKQINLGWTDFDYNKNMKTIEELISKGTKQIIFSGLAHQGHCKVHPFKKTVVRIPGPS